jgi:hypothetical protein
MNDMPGISPRLAMQFSIDLIQYDFPGGTIKIVAISSFLLKLVNFNQSDQCHLTEYFKTKKYTEILKKYKVVVASLRIGQLSFNNKAFCD